MPQPEPANQQPAAPATPAEPVQPAGEPAPAAPAAPAPAAPAPAEPAAPAEGAPTPGEGGDGQQPSQQTRQERRDQERQQRQSPMAQLNQQPQQPQGQPNQQPFGAQGSPQFPQYQPGQEVSPEQLRNDVVQTASAIANLQVQQQLQQHTAKNNLDSDISSVPQTFEELNPDNDAYTPELDEAITAEYQERAFRIVGYDNNGQPVRQLDPSVRLSDIAKRHVTSARALATRLSASNQAGQQAAADARAPRPTGATPNEVPFAQLSRDEQRKRLGYAKT